jgi:hypothetical protein
MLNIDWDGSWWKPSIGSNVHNDMEFLVFQLLSYRIHILLAFAKRAGIPLSNMKRNEKCEGKKVAKVFFVMNCHGCAPRVLS